MLLFAGTVRELTGDRRTAWLSTSALRQWLSRNCENWRSKLEVVGAVVDSAIVHRLGRLELGETTVVVAMSSPHRRAAFEAGQWLIDTLKQVVPIWKKEHWADGSTFRWIHPGPQYHELMSISGAQHRQDRRAASP